MTLMLLFFSWGLEDFSLQKQSRRVYVVILETLHKHDHIPSLYLRIKQTCLRPVHLQSIGSPCVYHLKLVTDTKNL